MYLFARLLKIHGLPVKYSFKRESPAMMPGICSSYGERDIYIQYSEPGIMDLHCYLTDYLGHSLFKLLTSLFVGFFAYFQL
jgi:hypothetical protein